MSDQFNKNWSVVNGNKEEREFFAFLGAADYYDSLKGEKAMFFNDPINKTFRVIQCSKGSVYNSFLKSSNSEPMETIKNKEPEQTQESPSKEIINALAFVGVAVLSVSIFYNAHIAYKNLKSPYTTFYQEMSLAIVCTAALILAILLIVFIVFLLSGEYNNWLKQNIDPYLLRIKSWLNRRNEQ